MEKSDFEFCLSVVEELKELLIVLSGNLNNAEKVIRRDEENERDYNSVAISYEKDDIVESLHDLAYMRITLENGFDWANHLQDTKH